MLSNLEIKRLSYRYKNNKVRYYGLNYFRQLIPSGYFQARLENALDGIKDLNEEEIMSRVNYYNKLEKHVPLSGKARKLSDLRIRESKTYFFDLYEYTRFFDQDLLGHFLFGDIRHIPEEPSITKSRPISDKNENSVLMKLNKVRHFIFVKNDQSYHSKKDMLVWRGKIFPYQPHRIGFLRKFYGHPMCDIGQVNRNDLNHAWRAHRMTISEQLRYKFILCLEGNDVASNLKWVMSSNSVAVMPKPKFETWFMEGRLIPDHHYISIKDDYSDLEDKLNYYLKNPDQAVEISRNANDFVAQFKNKDDEDVISLLVLKKYFEKTNQHQ